MVENQILAQKNFVAEVDPDIGETTEVSWTPPNDMTEQSWTTIGFTLQTVYRSMRWWLGDWLNHGDAAYGETYAQAIIMTDSALETLKKYKAVAQRIRKEDRIAELSWTHHFYVTYLPVDEHGPLLSIAHFHDITSRAFRQVVELPDDERAHLIDLWLNFDGPDHPQTLMALRTLEIHGTIYLPEDEDEEDGAVEEDKEESYDTVIDGEEYKYKTNTGDQVFDYWVAQGVPLIHSTYQAAEWKGLRVVAVLDEKGDPLLMWDMIGVE